MVTFCLTTVQSHNQETDIDSTCQPAADSTSFTPTRSVHVYVGAFCSVQFFTYVDTYGQKHSQDIEVPSQGPPMLPFHSQLPPSDLWHLISISMIFYFSFQERFINGII